MEGRSGMTFVSCTFSLFKLLPNVKMTGEVTSDQNRRPSMDPPREMTLAGSKAFIGQPAPNFKTTAVVNGDFKEISLNQFKGKYVVLFFYPLDFTFVCPTEIIAFSDRISEFKKLDVAVMACSTDSHFSHLAWVNTDRKMGGLGQMNIPILADTNHAISKAYGVLKEDEGIAYRVIVLQFLRILSLLCCVMIEMVEIRLS
ncbi:unnamed protein product [Onchocerca ochengi]|uniref:thioredoxin-dependent peroxiredoxin n=1 Tax=Onchocerca ochengi TaxID=42157 RepID=A0A182E7T3_ONCOC|nr:unnamed protein product [Onchocerca ochengi]